jgi:hypothetical protein
MAWRDVLAAGFLSLFSGAVMAAAPGPPPAPDPVPPMVFYVAMGAPDSCGRGCDSWIAVEGKVERDTAERFRKFLQPLKDRHLPIYFFSPGGDLAQALTMGRMLRERPTTARVARTMVKDCGTEQTSDVCLKLKQSGRVLDAELSAGPAICASACPYLLLGASTREIAPNAVMGVHTPKVVLHFRGPVPTADKRAEAVLHGLDHANQIVAAYLTRMGIDRGLLDLAKTVKFESMRVLTRDEIVRFGIDRRQFVETPWRFDSAGRFVSKIAVARKIDGVSFRRMDWRLVCYGKDRARLMLIRQVDKALAETPSVSLIAGSQQPLKLAALAVRLAGYEVLNAVVAPDAVKDWSALPRLQVAESSAMPDGNTKQATFEIETGGLEAAWTELAATCTAAPGNISPSIAVSGAPNRSAPVAAKSDAQDSVAK